MKRDIARDLERWLDDARRRPLVLRGARQVGKTWLVRDLAERAGRDLIELNFERDPQLRRYFTSNDPQKILGELSLLLNADINAERSLLFLDEIQAAGDLLAKLRWFHEELPALPVMAAGSLLEFTLTDHSFSMPVGRITFRHVEPMAFPEYLRAHRQERLPGELAAWRPGDELSPAAQQVATDWFHRYSMVGGMPAVVAADVEGRAPRDCRELQRGRIVPLELKAGAAGAMKSLHQFMFDKRLDLAVRCDTNPPSVMDVAVKTTRGDSVAYRLVNLPLYLLWNLEEVLAGEVS